MPIALNWISGSAVLARAASFIILAVKVVPGAGRPPRPHTDLAWAIVGCVVVGSASTIVSVLAT